jgi:hypothetical protein
MGRKSADQYFKADREYDSILSGTGRAYAQAVRRLRANTVELLLRDFDKHGQEAVETLRKRSPGTYLKIILSLPEQLTVVEDEELDPAARERLQRTYDALQRWRAAGEPVLDENPACGRQPGEAGSADTEGAPGREGDAVDGAAGGTGDAAAGSCKHAAGAADAGDQPSGGLRPLSEAGRIPRRRGGGARAAADRRQPGGQDLGRRVRVGHAPDRPVSRLVDGPAVPAAGADVGGGGDGGIDP